MSQARAARILRRYVFLLADAHRRGELTSVELVARTGAAWDRLTGGAR